MELIAVSQQCIVTVWRNDHEQLKVRKKTQLEQGVQQKKEKLSC